MSHFKSQTNHIYWLCLFLLLSSKRHRAEGNSHNPWEVHGEGRIYSMCRAQSMRLKKRMQVGVNPISQEKLAVPLCSTVFSSPGKVFTGILLRSCSLCMKNVVCHISKQRILRPSSHQPWNCAPWGDSGQRKAGYRPQIAKVQIKWMISMSPDSCIFPYIDKR